MALTKLKNDVDLEIKVKVAEDENGKPVYSTHRFSKVKITAEDEKVHAVAVAISDVISSMGLEDITKVESFSLFE